MRHTECHRAFLIPSTARDLSHSFWTTEKVLRFAQDEDAIKDS
jgi:hypothetical protein